MDVKVKAVYGFPAGNWSVPNSTIHRYALADTPSILEFCCTLCKLGMISGPNYTTQSKCVHHQSVVFVEIGTSSLLVRKTQIHVALYVTCTAVWVYFLNICNMSSKPRNICRFNFHKFCNSSFLWYFNFTNCISLLNVNYWYQRYLNFANSEFSGI